MAYTTINKSTDYFNTKLYTGNGSAGTAQTGVGFQPDFTWIKARAGTQGTQSHILSDAVRGAGKFLYSDSSDAESTDTNRLTSFNADGFTVGSNNSTNASSTTYASWNWKAGGSGSSNSDGSITSTVSANTTAGFSIVKYTGTGADMTVGHGLGAVPKMIIVKALSTGSDPWWTYHASLGNSAKLRLNGTQASQTTSDYIWNQTDPTSSVFSLDGTNQGSNANGNDFIAYCFAEKTGFSKFGSYTGNGNADGTFVYTGFKPAYVTIKRTNNTSDWHHFDNKRGDPVNNGGWDYLKLNTSDVESTASGRVDFLSNGFKLRYATGNLNENGDSFIYNSFAEAPLVGTNNVPCTAR